MSQGTYLLTHSESLLKAAAFAAVASGFFRLVEESASGVSSENATGEEAPDFEVLAAMSKAELIAYAENHEIELKGCRTKDDILGAISVFYGGSYTMIDLQK